MSPSRTLSVELDQPAMSSAVVNAGGATGPTVTTIRTGSSGGVNVTYGSSIELTGGVTISGETLTLNGNGEAALSAMPLRNVSGTNTWQGNVGLSSNRTGIDVAGGSKLIIDGIVSNQSFNKFGGGTLQFAGAGDNTFANGSIIWDGTLELNKSAGVNAIPSLAADAELFVGNFYGGNNSATLKLMADNQIAEGPFRVRVMPTGLFDLNGQTESLLGRNSAAPNNNRYTLALEVGPGTSGDVDLKGGILTLANPGGNGNGRLGILNSLAGGTAIAATIGDSSVGGGGQLQLFPPPPRSTGSSKWRIPARSKISSFPRLLPMAMLLAPSSWRRPELAGWSSPATTPTPPAPW